MNLPAVLLAAGEGRRLGGPKALIDMEGMPMLGLVAGRCRDAGFGPLVAVVPTALRDRVHREITGLDAVRENPDPATGPLRSLQIGMESLPEGSSGLLLVKVDFALVAPETYASLAKAIAREPSTLWRPVWNGRHGHPVWFPGDLFGALQTAPIDEGARAVVYAHSDRWGDVAVSDPWIHQDIDHPTDLEAARRTIRGLTER